MPFSTPDPIKVNRASPRAAAETAQSRRSNRLGVSEPTFYRWKKQFAGMGVMEIRRAECLNAFWSLSLADARAKLEAW
jgi:hypothetical protein